MSEALNAAIHYTIFFELKHLTHALLSKTILITFHNIIWFDTKQQFVLKYFLTN